MTRSYVYVGAYTASHTPAGRDRPTGARGISVFELDLASGALRSIEVAEAENPAWLELSSDGRMLYAVNESVHGAASAFAVDPDSGHLTFVNSEATQGAETTHLCLDPSGRFVLTANYSSGTFSVLPIRDDGRLGPVSDTFAAQGRGAHAQRQDRPHAHQVRFSPDGRFVFGADLGLDRLWSWRLEPTGTLAPNEIAAVQVASGAGARHFDFSPDGRWLYVLGELASCITAFAYDAARGSGTYVQTISTLPADCSIASTTAEIAVHPSGKYLFASNRGHDSIVGFQIDDGFLHGARWTPTQGQVPRGVGLHPAGDLLLVGNQASDSIVAFRVDPRSGGLAPTGAITQAPVPVAFAFSDGVIG